MGKQMANKSVQAPEGFHWMKHGKSYKLMKNPTGGYKLTHFTANAGSVATNANPAAATAGDELGYIGKSGRFVAITEAAT